MAASLSLKAAISLSSSLWISKVPERSAEAEAADGLDGGLLDLVAIGDAEVVVGGHVDEVEHTAGLAAADLHPGGRDRGERLGVEVIAVGPGLPIPVVEGTQQVEGV